MNGGQDVVLDHLFGDQNSILVVVALPGHEGHQHVLAQRDFALVGGLAVRNDLPLLDALSRRNDGALVDAGGLVGAGELDQLVRITHAVVAQQHDLVGRDLLDDAVAAGEDAHAGVAGGTVFDAGGHDGGVGGQQRNRLALHVCAHQGAVGVIVFQERNHGRSHGDQLLGADVHIVDLVAVDLNRILAAARSNALAHEPVVLIQRLVGLGDDVILFFVRGHIAHFVGHALVDLIHAAVGRLDEAIAVDAGIGRQCADQTDVGSFRRLNGAQTGIVRVVNVADVHRRAVTVQTAGAQGGGTALVVQFGQRVGLIEELRQLGGAEELLDRRGNRAGVDQGLGRDVVRLGDGHALAHGALQARQADADLVLQQLAHGAQAAVAQMVDIVNTADAVVQADAVAHGRHNVVHNDVLGHQVADVEADGLLQRLLIGIFLDQTLEGGNVHLFGNAHAGGIEIQEGGSVGKIVADDLDVEAAALVFGVQHHAVDARPLNLIGQLAGNRLARGSQNLAGLGMHDVLRRDAARDARGKRQLLVELIATDLGQIVSLGIEQQTADQGIGAVDCRGLAGTQLFIDLEQTCFHALGGIALQRRLQVLFRAQQVGDFVVGAVADGAQQYGHGQLARAVDAHPHHVVGIGFVFQPGAAAGDDGSGIERLAGLINGLGIVNAGGANQLGDNDTLRAVDDEGTRIGHLRQFGHENALFFLAGHLHSPLAGLLVEELGVNVEPSGVGIVALLALFFGIRRLLKLEAFKIQGVFV